MSDESGLHFRPLIFSQNPDGSLRCERQDDIDREAAEKHIEGELAKAFEKDALEADRIAEDIAIHGDPTAPETRGIWEAVRDLEPIKDDSESRPVPKVPRRFMPFRGLWTKKRG